LLIVHSSDAMTDAKSSAALKVLNTMMEATGCSMEDARAALQLAGGDPNRHEGGLLEILVFGTRSVDCPRHLLPCNLPNCVKCLFLLRMLDVPQSHGAAVGQPIRKGGK
jgi:hypothetical protein